MIFFVTQGEDLLEEMNYTKEPESIGYSISQYKNNVYSISNDKKTHYLSKGLSVVVKDKFLFDEPIATFKLIFEIFILNSNSGFKDSIYLSNAFFMRGKSYKIMLFSSSELMVLIKKYISNRQSPEKKVVPFFFLKPDIFTLEIFRNFATFLPKRIKVKYSTLNTPYCY